MDCYTPPIKQRSRKSTYIKMVEKLALPSKPVSWNCGTTCQNWDIRGYLGGSCHSTAVRLESQAFNGRERQTVYPHVQRFCPSRARNDGKLNQLETQQAIGARHKLLDGRSGGQTKGVNSKSMTHVDGNGFTRMDLGCGEVSSIFPINREYILSSCD